MLTAFMTGIVLGLLAVALVVNLARLIYDVAFIIRALRRKI